MQSKIPLTKNIRFLGGLAAFFFTVSLPVLYLGLSLYGLYNHLSTESYHIARTIEHIIQDRPDIWEFQHVRLSEIISAPLIDGHLDEIAVRSVKGSEVVKNSFSIAWPSISISEPLFDSGARVGSIESRHSIRKQVFVTALLGMLSASLGYLLFFIFRTYPVKKLENALQDLQKAKTTLRQQADAMDAATDGMAILNYKGEYIYLNKSYSKVYDYENVEILIEKSWRELHDHETLQLFDRKIIPELRKKGHWYGEAIGLKKNGSSFPQELSLSAMADGGFISVTRDITERKKSEEELKRTLKRLRKAFGATIHVLGSAVETRDPYTAGHQIRCADIARAIATEIGLSRDMIEGVRIAASIHDIGKLSIPSGILSKSAKLSELEYSLVKEHAQKGYEMLKHIDSPWPLAEMVYQHHERLDGSGYPRNLRKDEILIEARILAVADVVEAMTSHRPYRPALGLDAALAEIENNSGTLYEPVIVDACLKIFREKGFNYERTRSGDAIPASIS